jgi:hypothetical protein
MFTEPLPSTEWRDTLNRAVALQRYQGYTYRNTDWWERFMKYAIEMGSGAVIYRPSFIKIGSGI